MATYGESRNGYFGVITLFALLGILRLAALVWRSHSTWDRIDLALLIMGTVVIWIASLRQKRTCDHIREQLDDHDVLRLYGNIIYVACMACVMISIALHIGR
jgi:hypothetical protein